MKKLIFILFLFFSVLMVQSQNNSNTLNFWLGTWDAYWGDTLRGTNVISKTLKDNVVEENFCFNDKTFFGRSWSVFNPTKKIWEQTWVDDSGSYLALSGGQEGDKVVLTMNEKINKQGKMILKRMVFFNITKDSFDWDWQSSEDGKNWTSAWLIHYKRKK